MSLSQLPLITKERLILGSALVISIAVPAWLLRPASLPEDDAANYTQLSSLDLAQPADPADALAAPLFNPLRTDPGTVDENATDPASAEQAAATAGPPVPVGIITSRKAGGLALVRDSSGETTMVRTGQVVDGWTVAAIAQSGITLRKGSEERQLGLDYSNRAASSSTSVPPPSAAPPTLSRMGS